MELRSPRPPRAGRRVPRRDARPGSMESGGVPRRLRAPRRGARHSPRHACAEYLYGRICSRTWCLPSGRAPLVLGVPRALGDRLVSPGSSAALTYPFVALPLWVAAYALWHVPRSTTPRFAIRTRPRARARHILVTVFSSGGASGRTRRIASRRPPGGVCLRCVRPLRAARPRACTGSRATLRVLRGWVRAVWGFPPRGPAARRDDDGGRAVGRVLRRLRYRFLRSLSEQEQVEPPDGVGP